MHIFETHGNERACRAAALVAVAAFALGFASNAVAAQPRLSLKASGSVLPDGTRVAVETVMMPEPGGRLAAP